MPRFPLPSMAGQAAASSATAQPPAAVAALRLDARPARDDVGSYASTKPRGEVLRTPGMLRVIPGVRSTSPLGLQLLFDLFRKPPHTPNHLRQSIAAPLR